MYRHARSAAALFLLAATVVPAAAHATPPLPVLPLPAPQPARWLAPVVRPPATFVMPVALGRLSGTHVTNVVPACGYRCNGSGGVDPKLVLPITKTPTFGPLSAHVKSFGIQEATAVRDPWEASVRGVRPGSRVSLDVQGRSRPVDWEAATLALEHGDHSKFLTVITRATRWERVDSLTPKVEAPKFDSLGQLPSAPLVIGGPQKVQVHAPTRIVVRGDEAPQRIVTNAAGLRTERYSGVQDRETGAIISRQPFVKSGLLQEHYQPWIVGENIRATPAFVDGKGNGVAKIVGLTAIPKGARLEVTNVDMENRRMEGHTVKVPPEKQTGSFELIVPAPGAGGTYRVTVVFDGTYEASTTVIHTMYFQLPTPENPNVRQLDLYPTAFRDRL